MGTTVLNVTDGPYSFNWTTPPSVLAGDEITPADLSSLVNPITGVMVQTGGGGGGSLDVNGQFPAFGSQLPNSMPEFTITFNQAINPGYLPTGFELVITDTNNVPTTINAGNAATYGTWTIASNITTNDTLKFTFDQTAGASFFTSANEPYTINWSTPPDVSLDGINPEVYANLATTITSVTVAGGGGGGGGAANLTSWFPAGNDTFPNVGGFYEIQLAFDAPLNTTMFPTGYSIHIKDNTSTIVADINETSNSTGQFGTWTFYSPSGPDTGIKLVLNGSSSTGIINSGSAPYSIEVNTPPDLKSADGVTSANLVPIIMANPISNISAPALRTASAR